MQVNSNEINLLARLLRHLGGESMLSARLWATDPEGFGAGPESIAIQRGRSEAFSEAAKLVEDLGSNDK